MPATGGGTFQMEGRGQAAFWTPRVELRPSSAPNPNMQIIAGLDTVVRDMKAVTQMLAETTSEFQIAANRHSQMSLGGASFDPQMVSEVVRQSVESVISEAGAGRRAAATSEGSVASSGSRKPEGLRAYEQGRDLFRGSGGGLSLSNVRAAVGEQLEQSMGNLEWGEQLVQTEAGNWMRQGDSSTVFAPDSEVVQSFQRRQSAVGAARGFAQQLGKGATLRTAGLGALPVGLATGAGLVAGGLFAADQVGDWMEGERAKNASLQRHIGGTQADLWRERNINQRLFTLGQTGFMRDEDAQQLFQSVAQTGLRGEQREGALSFAADAYRDLGMSVADSVRLIEHASKVGQESLTTVASSLRGVSEAAIDAGVSAEQARQQYIEQYMSLTNIMGAQPAAAFAGALSTATASLGPGAVAAGFGIDMSSSHVIRTTAWQMGISPQQALAGFNDPSMQADFFDVATQSARQIALSFFPPGSEPIIMARLRQSDRNLNGKIPDPELDRIVRELTDAGMITQDPAVAAELLTRQGVQGVNMATAFRRALQIIAGEEGGYDPGGDLRKQQASLQVRDASSLEASTGGSTVTQSMAMGALKGLHPVMGAILGLGSARGDSIRSSMGLQGTQFGDDVANTLDSSLMGMFKEGSRDRARLAQATTKAMEESGMAGGIAARIAMDPNAMGVATKVAVRTKDGFRAMSLAEAMRDHFDQVQRGDLEIIEGTGIDQRLTDVFGTGMIDSSVTVTSDQLSSSRGMSIPEFRTDSAGRVARGETSGTVVLDFSDEARRWLRATTTGAVTQDDFWYDTPPHVASDQLPSGNG